MSDKWYWGMGNPDGTPPQVKYRSHNTHPWEDIAQNIVDVFAPRDGSRVAQCDEITVVDGRIYLRNQDPVGGNWWYYAREGT